MIRNLLLMNFAIYSCLFNSQVLAIIPPVWTRTVNAQPDTNPVFPVKVLNDINGNCYVLSTYSHTITIGNVINKVYLTRFDFLGNMTWQFVFDNGGTGQPRGFDMCLDNSGNCYIAGGWMSTFSYQPLFIKVNVNGSLAWQHTSTTAFQTDYFDVVILKNNFLFLKSSSGIAKFDTSGTELWSHPQPAYAMAVDDSSRIVVSSFTSGLQTLFRYHSDGTFDFSAQAILARNILCDASGNIFLLSQNPDYAVAKFDSAGNFSWQRDNFATPLSFQDPGFGFLMDQNGDLLLLGIQDSIYKFSSGGTFLWRSSMQGLDSYQISGKIFDNNLLVVTGSLSGFSGYDMVVVTYDLMGHPNWTGYYNANTGGREYAWDVAADGTGIYVIEDDNNLTTLAKFNNPALDTVIDYSLICVDSIWYDAVNPALIHVNVFNGGVTQVNYPSVQIVSPQGDTISNENNAVVYFAQLGNSFTEYIDTITQAGITDFSNYTFLLRENFGALTHNILHCATTGITTIQSGNFLLYPNPVFERLHFRRNAVNGEMYEIKIVNSLGEVIYSSGKTNSAEIAIETSDWSHGVYTVICLENSARTCAKFIH